MTLAHPAIQTDQMIRVAAGLLFHDSIENNPHVTKKSLIPHIGHAAANDIDHYYSRKRASDIQEGRETELSPEDYLARFLTGELHIKMGKINDRIHNMRTMPSGARKMYDRYFRNETEAMVEIIKSMGHEAKNVYERYREVHNKNKRSTDPPLPPFDETG